MSRRIENEAEFIELLEFEGWVKEKGGRFQSPYDNDVRFTTWERRFYKDISLNKPNRYGHMTEARVLGTIPNFKHIVWTYEEETGLLENGVIAIRIR